jgi:glycosyltransferase involved in cell wall biosynthesis
VADRPLITIIIVCRDYGAYVADAIESALAQTYDNLEVVVVDNGSSDDSAAVIARYADRVRVLTHPARTLERAFNAAVGEAHGDYLARLDADDVFEPHYLGELWRALERSPDAAYAYCRPMLFGAREGAMRCMPFSPYFLVRRTNFVNASALMARADFLAAGGYSEDLGEHAFEDWDLWLRLLEAGKRGTYVREPLLRWRRHTTGSRNPEDGERADAAIAFVRARHRRLIHATNDLHGRASFALDFAVAAADLVLGLSRWPRIVQAVERASWRRFRRHVVPKLAA